MKIDKDSKFNINFIASWIVYHYYILIDFYISENLLKKLGIEIAQRFEEMSSGKFVNNSIKLFSKRNSFCILGKNVIDMKIINEKYSTNFLSYASCIYFVTLFYLLYQMN